VQKATRHDHLGRDTATKRLNLLPDVAEESVAGPTTKQHDGVHRYTVEIHCHDRRQAKGVESDALWVKAQAFEIDARDETSEHPQGGCGVKIAGTSVVALEFVNVGLGSTHCLELADHCGADNHRTISTVAGAPLGHCVVAFVALLILESDCNGVGYVEPGQQMRQNSAAFSEHHVAFSYRMDLPLAGKLEVFAALHREKETQKHKLVKNNKNRQVGNWTLEHLETFGNLRRKTRVNNG